MKIRLIIIIGVGLLFSNHSNVKVYAAPIEQPVAGITTVLDKVNQLEIDMSEYMLTKDSVNMRKEASTNSDIVTTLDERIKVKILKKTSSDKWIFVEYENYKGYVYAEYLRDTKLFTSTANRWGIELTYDEIELLAKIVWTEARGEITDGKIACIETIFNRIISFTYPDTIYEVLADEGEFASWEKRNEAKPTEDIYTCIYQALSGETDILSTGYIYFSTSPRNNNGTIKIDHHYFCLED